MSAGAMYLSNPLIALVGGGAPTEGIPAPSNTTFLGRGGLGRIDLNAPIEPPPIPDVPAVPQPPEVTHAGIDW